MMQTASIQRAREMSKKEISSLMTLVPSCPPAMGIIFPNPVTAAKITAIRFAKVP